jgi:hypothetical protein
VQARGDKLLAGAALADHQHRPVQGRHARDLLGEGHEGGGFAEQRREIGAGHGVNIAKEKLKTLTIGKKNQNLIRQEALWNPKVLHNINAMPDFPQLGTVFAK